MAAAPRSPSAANLNTFTKRRIFADVRELSRDPSSQYFAEPLEDNLFEWHFTIRGPSGTDFEGGIYHGRIILPSDYPFKPPNIVFLTPNGRFDVGKKICLSISAHHPEEWQAAWGVRLMLEALISFLPTDGNGALGALDYSSSERKRLAEKSKEWCCARCGKIANLIPEMSEDEEDENEASVLPTKSLGVSEAGSIKTSGEKIQKMERKKKKEVSKYANEIAKLHCHAIPTTPKASPKSTNKDDRGASSDSGASASDSGNINGVDSANSSCSVPPPLGDSSRLSSVASSKPSTTIGQITTEGIGEPEREAESLQAHEITSAEEGTVENDANSQSHQASQAPGVATRGTVGTVRASVQGRQTGHGLSEDPLLWVAWALGIAIAAILLQKVSKLLALT